jgi:hypothetical protein
MNTINSDTYNLLMTKKKPVALVTCHPCSVNPRGVLGGVQFIPHTTNVIAKEAKFVYINVHDIHKGDCKQ